MPLYESSSWSLLTSGTTEEHNGCFLWSENSGWQPEVCHQPSDDPYQGLKSYIPTKPSGKSISSDFSTDSSTSSGSNASSGSNVSSGSNTSRTTSVSTPGVHHVVNHQSHNAPRVATALTADFTWSSRCQDGFQAPCEREVSQWTVMNPQPEPSLHGLQAGLEELHIDTTRVDPAHYTTPTQCRVDTANTHTSCGFPDFEELRWISAEDEFTNDPAHLFWSWDEDDSRWIHKDETTGSIIVCPDELD